MGVLMLPREALGVRSACWRCRKARAVQKREQAPRTPNASRRSVAAPPRRRFGGGGEPLALSGLARGLRIGGRDELPDSSALTVWGIDYRADFAGQIDWNGRLCHMSTDLVGNRRHDDYAGRDNWKS